MSPSLRKFRTWIDSAVGSQTAAARVLGISVGHVSLILAGKRRPSLQLAAKIYRATKKWNEGPVEMTGWGT